MKRRFTGREYNERTGIVTNAYLLEGRGAHTIEHAHHYGHWIESPGRIAVYTITPEGPKFAAVNEPCWAPANTRHMVIALDPGVTPVRCSFKWRDTGGDPFGVVFPDPYEEACLYENLPAFVRQEMEALI